MITRAVLEEQKKLYEKGREEARIRVDQIERAKLQAVAEVNAFNGAIDATDHYLEMIAQHEEAQSHTQSSEDKE